MKDVWLATQTLHKSYSPEGEGRNHDKKTTDVDYNDLNDHGEECGGERTRERDGGGGDERECG